MADMERPIAQFDDDLWEKGTLEIGDEAVEFTDRDPEPEAKTPSYEELAEKVKEADEARAQRSEVDGMREAIESLAKFQHQKPSEPTPQREPEESWEAFSARVKDQIFGDNPADAIREVVQKSIGGDLFQLAEYAKAAHRNAMKSDQEFGTYFNRFETEIESEVNRRPDRYTNPSVYREATETVTGRHWKELIAEEVQKQMQTNGGAGRGPRPAAEFTEAGRQEPPTKTEVRRIRTTPEDERTRLSLGMTKEDYYRSKRGR